MSVKTGITRKGFTCVVVVNGSERARLVAEGFSLPADFWQAIFSEKRSAYCVLNEPMVDITDRVDPVAYNELWKAARRWENE